MTDDLVRLQIENLTALGEVLLDLNQDIDDKLDKLAMYLDPDLVWDDERQIWGKEEDEEL